MSIYEKRWTIVGGDALHLPNANGPACFALDVPPSGFIKKLIVRQADGSNIGGKLNLYNEQVCPVYPADTSSSDALSDINPEMARIIPQQTLVASTPLELFVTDQGYAYRNLEGSYSAPVRKIYLEINPTGSPSGVTIWEVALAIVPTLSGV